MKSVASNPPMRRKLSSLVVGSDGERFAEGDKGTSAAAVVTSSSCPLDTRPHLVSRGQEEALSSPPVPIPTYPPPTPPPENDRTNYVA